MRYIAQQGVPVAYSLSYRHCVLFFRTLLRISFRLILVNVCMSNNYICKEIDDCIRNYVYIRLG